MSVEIRVNLAFATAPKGIHHSMFVTAVSTPAKPRWRWRITSPAGDLVDESRDDFATIAAALLAGRRRAAEMPPMAPPPDDPEKPVTWRRWRFGHSQTRNDASPGRRTT